jgi:hypothetical protein
VIDGISRGLMVIFLSVTFHSMEQLTGIVAAVLK